MMLPASRRGLFGGLVMALAVGLVSVLGLGGLTAAAIAKAVEPGPFVAYSFPPGWSTSPSTPSVPLTCRPENFPLPADPTVCQMTKHLKGAPTVFLWGDSHAWQEIPAIEAAIGHRRVNFVASLLGTCPVLDPPARTAAAIAKLDACPQSGALAMRYLTKLARRHQQVRVVVAEGWQIYHRALQQGHAHSVWTYFGDDNDYARQNGRRALRGSPAAFAALGRLHIPTDVVGPMPMAPMNAPTCRVGDNPYACPLPRSLAMKQEDADDRQIRSLMSRLTARGRLIQPSSYLCNQTACRGQVAGHPAYWDRLHISAEVSSRYGEKYFGPTIDALLASARHHRS